MRLPTKTSVSGPARMGVPSTAVQRIDTVADDIAGGVADFAQGVSRGANALASAASRQIEQDNAVDLSRAEAAKTAAFLDIQNRVAQDNDYSTYGKRYAPEVDGALGTAAGLIRDPRMRERWAAAQQSAKIQMMDSIGDRGVTLQTDFNRAGLKSSLEDNMTLLSDPTVPREVRDKAESDMLGSLDMGVATGLIEPGTAVEWRDAFLKGGRRALGVNLAELDIATGNAQAVMTGMAIPNTGAGQSLMGAMVEVNGGPLPMEFSLAKMGAELIGDNGFPDDPELAAAYLSDPEKAEDYAVAVQTHLSDRYKGDLSAVAVAMDPDGGTELADRWVKSGHDSSVLPAKVRGRVEEALATMTVEQPSVRIPIVTDPGVDITNVEPAVLQRFEDLQSRFGVALPIKSGYRDAEHNAKVGGADKSMHIQRGAIDIDVSNLPKEERVKLIEMASAMGFTGIGVYENSLHLDVGNLRAWGPDYHRETVPAWAEDSIAKHTSGEVVPVPSLYSGVAPEFADLTFDQRLTLYNKAKTAVAQGNVDMRASLAVVMDNAPAAIASTGTYDGSPMPTATDFVKAFGASEGIDKWKAFDAAIDTSKTIFGMKTMPTSQIQDEMADAVPMSSGNNAALERDRYQAITQAGKAVLEARAKDPAGYTLDAFPNVAAAFEAASEDPSKFATALTAMSEAQAELGISSPQLLPKALATQAVSTFKDITLGGDQRIASVAGLVLQTSDPAQQDQIFRQLVGEGLDPMLGPALDAMRRGDMGAANTLMRAALFDPNDIKMALPGQITDTDIKNEIAEIFAPGQVGDVVYGAMGATADNMEAMKGGVDIMFRDAKQRLLDGTAANAQDAVRLASQDVFGDDQVVSGNGGTMFGIGSGIGVKVTAPKDVDTDMLREGFNNLATVVRSSLRTLMVGPGIVGASPGVQKGLEWSVDNYVDSAMAEGYFTNGGGFLPPGQKGYVFYDPNSDAAITQPDGTPLVFTLDDVLMASSGRNFSGSPDERIARR